MRRKRSSYDESGGPNWLDTYADMVTLLLTFFVLLFSMSTINAQKWEMLVKSFKGASQVESPQQFVVRPRDEDKEGEGVLQGEKNNLPVNSTSEIKEFDDLYAYYKKYIKDNNLESDVQLFKGDDYTCITFRNNVFFDGDSEVIKPDGKVILDTIADSFKNINNQIGLVMFSGHTARGSNNSNQANRVEFDRKLSSARATNTLVYVQSKNTLHGKKLVNQGWGEFHPVVPHDGTESARIKNRRVEIYILKEGEKSKMFQQLYEEVKEK